MANDDYTAMLERQVAHFASDDFVAQRAAEYRGATPAECWAVTVELCASLDWFLDRMDPETRARVMEPEPLADDIVALLEALQRAS